METHQIMMQLFMNGLNASVEERKQPRMSNVQAIDKLTPEMIEQVQ